MCIEKCDDFSPDYMIAAEGREQQNIILFVYGEDAANVTIEELIEKGYNEEDIHLFPTSAEIL